MEELQGLNVQGKKNLFDDAKYVIDSFSLTAQGKFLIVFKRVNV